MRVSFFIARRLYFSKHSNQRVSTLAIRIATFGVMIGLAIMILSICIVLGFKHEISSKVIGFGSHIEIMNSNASNSPESFPVVTDRAFCQKIQRVDGVKAVQRFSNKLGIIKTDSDFKGVLFKGISSDYNLDFLRNHLIAGSIPPFDLNKNENELVISNLVANQLHAKVGDKIFAYFFEKSMKMRRFHIAGIFETNMNQFDDNIVITNLYTVNRINGWDNTQSSGLELWTKDFSKLDATYSHVLEITRDEVDKYGNSYIAFTIKDLYSQIFDWLKLLDLNVWVILTLMICVACFTMISGLLILILEKTNTIGVLKALGGSNRLIRRVFVNYAVFIIGRGLLLGNMLGLGLAFIQYQWKIVQLNAMNYYVDHVPVLFNWWIILGVNAGTLLICIFALIGPSYLVSRIRPVKAIRFD